MFEIGSLTLDEVRKLLARYRYVLNFCSKKISELEEREKVLLRDKGKG